MRDFSHALTYKMREMEVLTLDQQSKTCNVKEKEKKQFITCTMGRFPFYLVNGRIVE